MDIARIATTRYTSKAFDPSRKIPAAQIEQLKTLLRYSPSSTNSQPWHFVLASTEAGKAKVAESTSGFYVFNAAKVQNASHVVVLCARSEMTDAHLARLLAQGRARRPLCHARGQGRPEQRPHLLCQYAPL